MPKSLFTHEQNRTRVCLLCFCKCNDGRPLTQNQKAYFEANICRNYFQLENYLPSVICNGCRIRLGAYLKKDGSTSKFNSHDYLKIAQDIRDRPKIDETKEDCKCKHICLIVRHRFDNIDGAASAPPKLSHGRPPTRPHVAPTPTSIKICTKCASELKPGLTHNCNQVQKLQNVSKIISPRSQERLASNILREKAMSEGSSFHLQAMGKPLSVSLPAKESSVRKKLDFNIPHETMFKMQRELNLSQNETARAGRILRQGTSSGVSRNFIEPNLRQAIRDKGKEVQSFFSIETLTFKSTSKEEKKPAIICNNVPEFINFIRKVRKVPDNHLVKIGIDGGGSFLKFCLNIIQLPFTDRSPTQSPVAKSTKSYADTGVKMLHIIGIAYEVQENYGNLKSFLNRLHLKGIEFASTNDLKMNNILSGLQSHAATHPCTWCEVKAPYKPPFIPRTLGSIRENCASFRNAGGVLKNASQYKNCVNMPLFTQSDDTLMIDIIVPPGLHLFLGAVNTIFDKLNDIWGNNNWDRYKVQSTHDHFGTQLHSAVVQYNSLNM